MFGYITKTITAKKIARAAFLVLTALLLISCGLPGSGSGQANPPGTTDEMFSRHISDAKVNIFIFDSRAFTVDNFYEISAFPDEPKDGHFYQLTADVTYLNGGVAGYVDYPQINSVTACEEISPFDLTLPKITEKRYGLVLIGDYADGDILLNEYGKKAVWKDGTWIYRYDKEKDGDNGTRIFFRSDVSEEIISKGIEEGILSCDDYFVIPAQNASADSSDDSSLSC